MDIAAEPGITEPEAAPAAGQGGKGRTPCLALDGFSGQLDWLLALARGRQIDLGRLSLPDLLDQLGAALHQASGAIPVREQGDWVVMTAGLLLRSRLLLRCCRLTPRRSALGHGSGRPWEAPPDCLPDGTRWRCDRVNLTSIAMNLARTTPPGWLDGTVPVGLRSMINSSVALETPTWRNPARR